MCPAENAIYIIFQNLRENSSHFSKFESLDFDKNSFRLFQ